jgi:hypothetical protein
VQPQRQEHRAPSRHGDDLSETEVIDGLDPRDALLDEVTRVGERERPCPTRVGEFAITSRPLIASPITARWIPNTSVIPARERELMTARETPRLLLTCTTPGRRNS